MKDRFSPVLLAVSSLAAWTFGTLQAQQTNPLTQEFDPAPGVDGALFSSTSGPPAMNESLLVAFRAFIMGSDSASSSAIGANNSGIWADDGSGIQLVVQAGSPDPYTGALFSSFSEPVYNNNNAVAFIGTLREDVTLGVVAFPTTQYPVVNTIGIWSTDGGSLHLVVRQGDTAPGYNMTSPVLFSSFSQFVLPDQGGVAFLANVVGNTIFSTNNQGIWAVDTSGNLQLIMQKGGKINGKTITALSFLTTANAEAGQRRYYAQTTGDLMIKCTFSDSTWAIVRVVFPSVVSS